MNEFQRHIGVGERQPRFGRHVGTARTSGVVVEGGRTEGLVTEHWNGRVDTTIMPEPVRLQGRLDRDGRPDHSTIQPKEMT